VLSGYSLKKSRFFFEILNVTSTAPPDIRSRCAHLLRNMGDFTTQIAPEQHHEGDTPSVERAYDECTSPVSGSVDGPAESLDKDDSEESAEPTEQFRIDSGPRRRRGGKYYSGEQLAIPGNLEAEEDNESLGEEGLETEPEDNKVGDFEASESESSLESQSEDEGDGNVHQLQSEDELYTAAEEQCDEGTSRSAELANLDRTVAFQFNTPKGLQAPAHGFYTAAYIPA